MAKRSYIASLISKEMPTPASSSGLRSRKFDFKKPLTVFALEELPEHDQQSVLNRNIPILATGVEKEEEEVSFLKTFKFSRFHALRH